MRAEPAGELAIGEGQAPSAATTSGAISPHAHHCVSEKPSASRALPALPMFGSAKITPMTVQKTARSAVRPMPLRGSRPAGSARSLIGSMWSV